MWMTEPICAVGGAEQIFLHEPPTPRVGQRGVVHTAAPVHTAQCWLFGLVAAVRRQWVQTSKQTHTHTCALSSVAR